MGRRTRKKRQPTDKTTPTGKPRTFQVVPLDLEWLSFLHRHHGRLPTSYLYDATKTKRTDALWVSKRLRDLHHELRLIDRDPSQLETLDPRWNELVHDISDEGIKLLQANERYSPFLPARGNPYKHSVFNSCVSASAELNARTYEHIEYRSLYDLVEHAQSKLEFQIDNDVLKPDSAFMLIKGGKALLVFVEVDRGTEQKKHSDSNKKTISKSIRQYRKLIAGGMFYEQMKLPRNVGAMVLFITVSPGKQANIIKQVATEFEDVGGKCNFILLSNIPEFGDIFHPPKLLDILGRKWERSGLPEFSLV